MNIKVVARPANVSTATVSRTINGSDKVSPDIIGFDNIQLSAYTAPPLTTVHVPHAKIAEAAVLALLRIRSVNGKKMTGGEQHDIRPVFLERRSTGPAPAE